MQEQREINRFMHHERIVQKAKKSEIQGSHLKGTRDVEFHSHGQDGNCHRRCWWPFSALVHWVVGNGRGHGDQVCAGAPGATNRYSGGQQAAVVV